MTQSDTRRSSKLGWIIAALAVLLVVGAIVAISAGRFAGPPSAEAAKDAPIVFSQAAADPRDERIAAARQAAETAPQAAASWFALGDAQLAKRRFAEAGASYRKGLAIDPENAAAWSALGETVIQTTQSRTARMPAEASAAFAEALKRNPDDLRATFYQTLEMDFAGQHDVAIGRWLGMLRMVPAGSHESDAIRQTIAASVRRNLQIVNREVEAALAAAPKAAPGGR